MANAERRQLLRLAGLGSAVAAVGTAPGMAQARAASAAGPGGLSQLFLARAGKTRRSSSWDRTGRNFDYASVEAGATATLAEIEGAGCIRHIWMTIYGEEPDYLRRMVLRAWWDGETQPSIESPVGDFFGVGHGRVSNYWSAPLNMVTGGRVEEASRAAMNSFFPMPFATGARLTLENQGEQTVRALYYYIDYEEYPALPDEALRFHAQWRRQSPTPPTVDLSDRANDEKTVDQLPNLDGASNYVILEATGRGHYVGCNVSVDHLNPITGFGWLGEGDDMIWIDGEPMPTLRGTGMEDYFCAAFGYPGGHNSMPYHGISLAGPTAGPAPYSGKWTMYRYHIEDPLLFETSIKVTIEHGHANVHADDYSSVAYWYQTEPHTAFPALAPVERRLPIPERESLRSYWKTF